MIFEQGGTLAGLPDSGTRAGGFQNDQNDQDAQVSMHTYTISLGSEIVRFSDSEIVRLPDCQILSFSGPQTLSPSVSPTLCSYDSQIPRLRFLDDQTLGLKFQHFISMHTYTIGFDSEILKLSDS